MAIDIMQRASPSGDPEKGVKVPGTGLVLYPGGTQKTPTGMSNAFTGSGLTPDDLLTYAAKYDLPTTSNKEFQQAQYDLLNSSARGRSIIKAMEAKYGKPASGSYVDGLLGARTLDMMKASTPGREEGIRLERTPIDFKLPPPTLRNVPKQKSKWDGYGPYVIASTDFSVPDRVYNDYDQFAAHISRGRDRGVNSGNGQGIGQTEHPNGGEYNIIPMRSRVEQNYDDDVFSGLDLPHEEENFSGTGLEKGGAFNEEYERTRTPLGVIDKETGKFVPYRMDPNGAQRRDILYLQKMIKENPDKFDLNKIVNNNLGTGRRKLDTGKNQFHPENNPLSGQWGNQNFGRRE